LRELTEFLALDWKLEFKAPISSGGPFEEIRVLPAAQNTRTRDADALTKLGRVVDVQSDAHHSCGVVNVREKHKQMPDPFLALVPFAALALAAIHCALRRPTALDLSVPLSTTISRVRPSKWLLYLANGYGCSTHMRNAVAQ
jgi:hypothetical protein